MQLVKMTDAQIRKNGIDAHKLKINLLKGTGASISNFDLCYDKDTRGVYVVKKTDSSVVLETGVYITP